MKFINFRVIEFSVAVSGGIMCAYSGWIAFPLWPLLPVFVLISVGIWIWNRKHLAPSPWNPLVNLICFFLIGFINFQAGLPEFQENHFSKESDYPATKMRVLQITEVLKASNYNEQYEAKCIPFGNDKSVGRVFLKIKTEDSVASFNLDDVIIVYGNIEPILPPKNPSQFDYRKHLALKGIYHQISISKKAIIDRKIGTQTLRGKANHFRTFLLQKLDQTTIGSQEKSIIQALILGDKRSIDTELYESYASAGAVHILAVSGLHVGILLLLLNFLFRPLLNLPKGKWIRMILILMLLWSFAFIAGLSPSIVRAVTMFSLFTVADLSHRPTNTINTLFLSYFLLLLIQPNWLFQVGFQLSYMAVGSIIWIQPKLNQLWRPRYWITKKIWDIITVTFAAQVGVAPLSIYYFHQFPGMFLITNIVVLPILALLLIYGIIVITLAALEILPELIAKGYHLIIGWLNLFIKWIASQTTFIFENLTLSFWGMLIIYMLIISLLLAIYTQKRQWLFGFLGGCLLLYGHYIYGQTVMKNEWVLFHLYGKTIMTMRTNSEISIYANGSELEIEHSYPLRSYMMQKGTSLKVKKDRPDVFALNQDTFIILDSLGVYPRSEKAVIVLTHNPKVHLDRLIDSIQPKLIIVDGSNYPIYVRRWKSTCKNKKIPFYNTQAQGAYILELKN